MLKSSIINAFYSRLDKEEVLFLAHPDKTDLIGQ